MTIDCHLTLQQLLLCIAGIAILTIILLIIIIMRWETRVPGEKFVQTQRIKSSHQVKNEPLWEPSVLTTEATLLPLNTKYLSSLQMTVKSNCVIVIALLGDWLQITHQISNK